LATKRSSRERQQALRHGALRAVNSARKTQSPGSETGGEVATWGRATSNRVDAMGVKWDATGKSSKHIPFDWSGPG